VGYLQTLGFQVNLYGIADALGRHYGVAESVFWEQLRAALAGCLAAADLPAHVAGVVRRQLLRAPTWPTRQILGPLLSQGSSDRVSMPAGTGATRNPLLRTEPADRAPAGAPLPAVDAAQRAARQRLLNAFVRESEIRVHRSGALRIPLPAAGSALIAEVSHRSACGHHEYADALVLEQADGRRADLEHDAFVDVV